jgi:hypothetical protein
MLGYLVDKCKIKIMDIWWILLKLREQL